MAFPPLLAQLQKAGLMVRKRILEAKVCGGVSLLGSVLGSATVTIVAEAAAVGRAYAAGKSE